MVNCVFCGAKINDRGNNNPSPFTGSTCCDDCNLNIVVKTRIFLGDQNKEAALIITTDKKVETLKPKGKYFTLQELQKSVGGYIEIYPARYRDHLIVCDEEGLLKKKKLNKTFKQLTTIGLVGDVLLIPENLFEQPEEDPHE